MTTEQVLGQFFSDDSRWHKELGNYSGPGGSWDGYGKPIEHREDFWGPGMKHAIILGAGSDIAKAIRARLEASGWSVSGQSHDSVFPLDARWDLLIVACGTMEPIGKFFDCSSADWRMAIDWNALHPLSMLRAMWDFRKQGAKVVFFGGPNLSKPTPTYTAYRAGKALLASLVDTLNLEYPENKFILFNPGIVNTKIHKQTIEAGNRAANYERVLGIVSGEEPSVPMETVVTNFLAAVGINPFVECEGT